MKKITLLLLVAVMTSLGTLAQSISTSPSQSGDVVFNGAVGTASGITATTMFGNRAPANLTHSATQNIVPGTPTCNAGGILSAGSNGFYRVFDLASFGITDDYRVRSLEFGVETITTATTFPVTVNVYSGPPGTFPGALGTSVRGSATTLLTNADAGTIVSVVFDPMVEVIVPAGEELVFEVFANGDGATSFFPGSNGDGETDDSYLAAFDCGLLLPDTMTSIGFPGVHLVMNVIGHRVIPPIISCPVDIVVDNQTGVCGAVVNFGAATAIDPEGGPVTITQTMGDPTGSVFPIGVSTIEFTATDEDGETATCTFTITVNDVEDPTITCAPDQTQTNDPGVCGANVTVVAATPMDNCPTDPAPSVTGPLTQMIFVGGDLADTPSTVTGLMNSVGGDVVVDATYTGDFGFATEGFELEGPDGSVVFSEAGGATGGDCTAANPSFTIPEATWNGWITTFGSDLTFTLQADPDVDLFCALNEFQLTFTLGTAGVLTNDYTGTADASGFYPVGTTAVTWTYTDAAGNSASCVQNITVTDDEAPVIACEGEPMNMTDTASASPGSTIVDSVSSTITITDDETITDLDIDLDIAHTWVGDLVVTLESPAGTSVTLLNAPLNGAGDCLEDDVLATLDDDAASPVDAECNPGSPAIGGTFMPSSPLSAFNGESTLGDWTLTIVDIEPAFDDGTLNSWAMNYSFDVVGTPFEVDLDANGMVSFPASDLLAAATDNCGTVNATVATMDTVSLETTFAAGNGQSGNMFDVTAINDLTIQSFDVSIDSGFTDDVEVYFKTGTHVGSEQDAAAWTLLATAAGITSAGDNVATPLGLSLGVNVAAGETVAFYVTLTNSTAINYTNGTNVGDLFASDANLEFFEGTGNAYPFGQFFSPRVFNGNIVYDVAGQSGTIDLDCSNLGENLIEVTVTDAAGNVSSCFATVNVNDVTAPIIACGGGGTQSLLTNGSFEDGDFTGWTAIDNPNPFLAWNVAPSANNGFGMTPAFPTDGGLLANNGFDGDAGEAVLYQDVTIPSGVDTATLTWDENIEYDLQSFCTGCSDRIYEVQVRDQSDNVLEVIQQVTALANTQDFDGVWESVTADLSAYIGQDIRIAFWQQMPDSFSGPAQFALDNVVLETNTASTDVVIELDENGMATIDPFDIISDVTEACGIVTSAVDITEVSCDDIGTPLTVTAFVVDVGGNPAVCSATVVVVDNLAPVITCPADQTVDPGAGNLFYEVPDYFGTGEATAIDNCTDPVTITTQDPAPGTEIPDGVYTVTLTSEDEYGNVSTCSFELTVESVLGVQDNILGNGITMYPNPAREVVTINNATNIGLEQAIIFDANGRIVNTINLSDMQGEMTVDVSSMASGIYMVQIQGENATTVKRLVKE